MKYRKGVWANGPSMFIEGADPFICLDLPLHVTACMYASASERDMYNWILKSKKNNVSKNISELMIIAMQSSAF